MGTDCELRKVFQARPGKDALDQEERPDVVTF
jgi:hypothetical protein